MEKVESLWDLIFSKIGGLVDVIQVEYWTAKLDSDNTLFKILVCRKTYRILLYYNATLYFLAHCLGSVRFELTGNAYFVFV